MPIISTNNNYPSQVYGLNQNEKNSSKESQKTEETSDETKKPQKPSYTKPSSTTSWLQAAVSATMAGMGLGPTDKVTFSTIVAYRDQMQKDFDEKVKQGLKEAGVSEDTNFQLVSGPEGGIKVICDNEEEKAKIEKFFKDNPELVKDFEKIQALNNVEAMRKEQRIDPNAIRQRIQIESMTAWFAGAGGNSVSAIMNHSGGSSSFSSGVNTLV